MKREDYLQNKDIQNFTHWLSKIIAGQEKLNFHYTQTKKWNLLCEAFQDYKWPDRRAEWKALGDFNYPATCRFSIVRDSDFTANEVILNNLKEGLRKAFTKKEGIPPWLASIFVWGGVRKGNIDWLITNKEQISSILQQTYQAIQLQQDDALNWKDLRFNAGMTKVYSLLCDDFIIYDSRVAAALAWLVMTWIAHNEIPKLLQFQCMNAKGGKHQRNPNQSIFKLLNYNHKKHALWNIRANWIITEALQLAKHNQPQLILDTSRKVEAALFMMGYDLQYALKPSKLDK